MRELAIASDSEFYYTSGRKLQQSMISPMMESPASEGIKYLTSLLGA